MTPDEFDRRIEADALAGRLDAAGARADADFEAGLCLPPPPAPDEESPP